MIFTDTQESSRKVSLSLNHEPTLVTLPSSIYTVIAYDIVNGSIYGPAVYYPTLVEIMKVILSTSTSASMNEYYNNEKLLLFISSCSY